MRRWDGHGRRQDRRLGAPPPPPPPPTRGEVRYWKPIQTGEDCDTSTVSELCSDAALGAPTFRYPRPASPHHAAESAGGRVDLDALDDAYEFEQRSAPDALLFELAGGLHVPLVDATTNLDWITRHHPRVVLVARTALGTLNHTLLSLEALRSRRLEVIALFLVGESHPDNERTLRELGGVEQVHHLPHLKDLSADTLDAWLDVNDLSAALGHPLALGATS